MLNKSKSRRSLMAYALALPLMFGLFVSASMVSAQDIQKVTNSGEKGDIDVLPKPLNMNEVAAKVGYPKEAMDAGLEGKVLVQFVVGKAGEIEQVDILKSSAQVFTDAVVKHVEELKFSPGVKDGKAVKARLVLPFKFALNKDKKEK